MYKVSFETQWDKSVSTGLDTCEAKAINHPCKKMYSLH